MFIIYLFKFRFVRLAISLIWLWAANKCLKLQYKKYILWPSKKTNWHLKKPHTCNVGSSTFLTLMPGENRQPSRLFEKWNDSYITEDKSYAKVYSKRATEKQIAHLIATRLDLSLVLLKSSFTVLVTIYAVMWFEFSVHLTDTGLL